MAAVTALFGAQPVAFNGGPLDRQVHVWSLADVHANEAVWVADRRDGQYVRSNTWQRQQRDHRPVTYRWTQAGDGDYAGLRILAVADDGNRS